MMNNVPVDARIARIQEEAQKVRERLPLTTPPHRLALKQDAQDAQIQQLTARVAQLEKLVKELLEREGAITSELELPPGA